VARASVSPVAVVLLVALTVLAAGSVALALPQLPAEPPPKRTISVDATADGQVTVMLRSGPQLDVRNVDVRLAVDDESLRHQPPVPFFAADGFRGGPTGPFNVAADPTWQVGEAASVGVAGTNDPTPTAGATLRIRLLVRGHVVAVAKTDVVTRHVGRMAVAKTDVGSTAKLRGCASTPARLSSRRPRAPVRP
jgi:FlaG/FlaF family flagellin (archaellin)